MDKNAKEKINNIEIDNDNLLELKKLIIEMVKEIKNEKYLTRIYISIKDYLKEEKAE